MLKKNGQHSIRRIFGYSLLVLGIVASLSGVVLWAASKLGITTQNSNLELLVLSSGGLLLFLGWFLSSGIKTAWRLLVWTGVLKFGVVVMVSACVGFYSGLSGLRLTNPLDGPDGYLDNAIMLCIGDMFFVIVTIYTSARQFRESTPTQP